MHSKQRSVFKIAHDYQVDTDEFLLNLWYRGGFDYIKNYNSVIRQKDLFTAKKIAKLHSSFLNKRIVPRGKSLNTIQYDFSIGRVMNDIRYLNKQEVLKIHEELVNDFKSGINPIYPPGLKDEGLLEMAISHPRTSYNDIFKYKTLESAAAATMYALSMNHCFHNGNKRTSIVALLVFLDRHNTFLTCDEDDIFRMSLMMSDHMISPGKYLSPDGEIYELTKWVHSNIKIMQKGERTITFRRLNQILNDFDCRIYSDGRVERTYFEKNIFGLNHKKILRSKIPKLQQGHEVDKGLVKRIREELQLDCDHRIDTDSFYYGRSFSASEFIYKYKNLFRRLAKF